LRRWIIVIELIDYNSSQRFKNVYDKGPGESWNGEGFPGSFSGIVTILEIS
jgi:hypothetical protein